MHRKSQNGQLFDSIDGSEKFDFESLQDDYFRKNWRKKSDLSSSDVNLKITEVNQYKELNAKRNKGICGGLSTIHIEQQLQEKSSKAINPLASQTFIRRSVLMQEKVENRTTGWQQLTFWQQEIAQSLSLNDMRPIRHFPGDFNLERKLNRKVARTLVDHQSRGVLIGAETQRDIGDGARLKQAKGHAVSVTTQLQQGELLCTALESNSFFGEAHGKKACEELNKKIVDTLKDSYESKEFHVVTIRKE